jgi:hypothetical protein
MAGESCAQLPTGRHTKRLEHLREPGRHARPRLDKDRHTLCKDLAGTGGRITEELAHLQNELHLEASIWHISYHAGVAAMDTPGGMETERTARVTSGRDHLHAQQIIHGGRGQDLQSRRERKKGR